MNFEAIIAWVCVLVVVGLLIVERRDRNWWQAQAKQGVDLLGNALKLNFEVLAYLRLCEAEIKRLGGTMPKEAPNAVYEEIIKTVMKDKMN